jgi:hypothetical protein
LGHSRFIGVAYLELVDCSTVGSPDFSVYLASLFPWTLVSRFKHKVLVIPLLTDLKDEEWGRTIGHEIGDDSAIGLLAVNRAALAMKEDDPPLLSGPMRADRSQPPSTLGMGAQLQLCTYGPSAVLHLLWLAVSKVCGAARPQLAARSQKAQENV